MRLVANIYKDMFLNKRVRFKSDCSMAPVDITGTVTGIAKPETEYLFRVKSENNGKTYTIGANSPKLTYELL